MTDFEIFLLGSALLASILAYSYYQLNKIAKAWIRMWRP